jgi:tetratricopeptide (TPR) repeat protein
MRRQRGLLGLGVAFALIYGPLAAASPTPRAIREADRYSQFGNKALKTGNARKARSLYDKALKALPDFPDAHLGLGHLAMAESNFATALREYTLARDSYTSMEDSLLELQVLHFTEAQEMIGKLRDGIQQYHQILAGRVALDAPLLEKRIIEMEAAVQQLEQIKPPRASAANEAPGEVHFFIGNALFNLGRLDEAVSEWDDCARLTPKFPFVYNNLAVAYWKRGELEQARQSLSHAESLGMRVNPNFRTDLERVASAAAPGGP